MKGAGGQQTRGIGSKGRLPAECVFNQPLQKRKSASERLEHTGPELHFGNCHRAVAIVPGEGSRRAHGDEANLLEVEAAAAAAAAAINTTAVFGNTAVQSQGGFYSCAAPLPIAWWAIHGNHPRQYLLHVGEPEPVVQAEWVQHERHDAGTVASAPTLITARRSRATSQLLRYTVYIIIGAAADVE